MDGGREIRITFMVTPEGKNKVDDNLQCTNCGYYRSEHSMGGCDHFTTQKGGSVVYTHRDMVELDFDDIDEMFGRFQFSYEDDRDYDDDEVVDPVTAEMRVLVY